MYWHQKLITELKNTLMKPRVGKEQTRCRVAGVWQSFVLEFFVSFCFKTKRKEAN
jgi:hypothetical protein